MTKTFPSKWRLWSTAFLAAGALAVVASATAQVPEALSAVLTRSFGNSRNGANTSETILTTSNVNFGNFGKLFTLTVDDEVYAQPLYVSGLSIAGGTHNVVFIAT